MSVLTIGVAFDGGGQFGLGNIKRAQTLGQCIVKKGHKLVMAPLSENAEKLSGYERKYLFEHSWNAGIVDIPYSVKQIIPSLPVRENLLLALDQTVEGDFTAVNSSLLPPPQTKRALLGLDYVPIRSDLVSQKKKMVAPGELCLVSIGGGDISGLAEKVCQELFRYWTGPVTVIEGPNSTRRFGPVAGVDSVRDPENFAELLSLAACVVTTGGMTFLEALYLRKPVFGVPRTQAEEIFLGSLPDDPLILGVGIENLSNLAGDASRLSAIHSSTSPLIDGRGGERLVDYLCSLVREEESLGT